MSTSAIVGGGGGLLSAMMEDYPEILDGREAIR